MKVSVNPTCIFPVRVSVQDKRYLQNYLHRAFVCMQIPSDPAAAVTARCRSLQCQDLFV